MACLKCDVRRLVTGPCFQFDGPHRFCHTCGFTALVHTKSAQPPVLTVIEGGKGDDADRWSAWLNGEVQS